jgi:hypothetical protein
VIVPRFLFSRKIRGAATFDFCNSIGKWLAVNLCLSRAFGFALDTGSVRALLVRDPLAERAVALDLVLAFVVFALGMSASLVRQA